MSFIIVFLRLLIYMLHGAAAAIKYIQIIPYQNFTLAHAYNARYHVVL